MSNTKFEITENYECIKTEECFKSLLRVLMAYSLSIIGSNTKRLDKNKQELAYDFSMEAIKRYLENPNNFIPSKNPDLVNYIKLHILRRLISNFRVLKSQENEMLFEDNDSIGIKVSQKFEQYFPIEDLIDLKDIITKLRNELKNQDELLNLFELRYIEVFSRAEIINMLKISDNEYNNRIRRLSTVINRVKSKIYNYGESKL